MHHILLHVTACNYTVFKFITCHYTDDHVTACNYMTKSCNYMPFKLNHDSAMITV